MACPQDSLFAFGKCYYLAQTTASSWGDAEDICDEKQRFTGQKGYWTIGQITSQEQQSYIAQVMNQQNIDSVWLGMKKYSSDSDWKYYPDENIYSRQTATYFNWAPGEPNAESLRTTAAAFVNGADGKWYTSNNVYTSGPQRSVICQVGTTLGDQQGSGEQSCNEVNTRCIGQIDLAKFSSESNPCDAMQTYISDTVSCIEEAGCDTSTYCGSVFPTLEQQMSPVCGSQALKCEPNSSGLSPGAIAGIVIGSLVFVAIVGAVVFFFIKKRKTGNKDFTPNAENTGAPSSNGSFTNIVHIS